MVRDGIGGRLGGVLDGQFSHMVARHLCPELVVVEAIPPVIPCECHRSRHLDLESRSAGVSAGDPPDFVGDSLRARSVGTVHPAVHHRAAEHHRESLAVQASHRIDVGHLAPVHALVADVARTEGDEQQRVAVRVGRHVDDRTRAGERAHVERDQSIAEPRIVGQSVSGHERVAPRRVLVQMELAVEVSELVARGRGEGIELPIPDFEDPQSVPQHVGEGQMCSAQVAAGRQDREVEIARRVVAEVEHRQLRAGRDDRLADVGEHELHGVQQVGHGVGSARDHEAIHEIVEELDRVAHAHPVHPATVGRVDGPGVDLEPDHVHLLVEPLQDERLQELAGVVGRHQVAVLVLMHAESPAVVEDHDARDSATALLCELDLHGLGESFEHGVGDDCGQLLTMNRVAHFSNPLSLGTHHEILVAR